MRSNRRTAFTGSALTVGNESTFEMTQGVLEQTVPAYATAEQISAASDVVKVNGKSKIRLTGTSVHGLGAMVHLSGASEGVFESCELISTTATANGELIGPVGGYLVEDSGSLADIRNGTIGQTGLMGIKALSGGRIVANGLTLNNQKTSVQVEAGGKVELDNCTIGHTNGNGSRAVVIEAGGEAVIRNSTIEYFFETGIKVASGGKCEVTGCTIQNGKVGIQADPGSTVVQSGNQFNTLETEMAGVMAAGGM